MSELQALDPRYITLHREIGRIAAACLSVGLLVGLLIALPFRFWPLSLLLWLPATIALVWLFHAWPAVEYRHLAYRVDEGGIEIRSGVFWRAVTDVPRSRVQHTDVAQGPLERRHGLGRLVVYTAGTEHSRVELPGLPHDVALQIRDHLLPREAGDAV
ncbi:MAG: PH domain-containing protein [Acidobacteriota bacterium]